LLVIVERNCPRESGMCKLERRVGAIESIPGTILVQRHELPGACMLSHCLWIRLVFVNVVAEENHEVQVFSRHVLVGGVEASLVA
jgi:hypothetical protein